MSNLDTTNYLKINPTDGSPMELINAGDVKGQELVGYDEYTFAAEAVLADVIRTSMVLPKGARLIGVSAEVPQSGSTQGQFSVNAGATVVRAAATIDPGAGDVNSYLPAFYENNTDGELLITLVCAETTDSNDGTTIKCAIHYVVV